MDLPRLAHVIGVRGRAAHLPVAEPGLDIPHQPLFRPDPQQVAKAELVGLSRRGRFRLDLALQHLRRQLIDELEVLDDAREQRVAHRVRLGLQPRHVLGDTQAVFQ